MLVEGPEVVVAEVVEGLTVNIKVNEYVFRGSNSAIFIFASLYHGGPFLRDRICSPRSKFYS